MRLRLLLGVRKFALRDGAELNLFPFYQLEVDLSSSFIRITHQAPLFFINPA